LGFFIGSVELSCVGVVGVNSPFADCV